MNSNETNVFRVDANGYVYVTIAGGGSASGSANSGNPVKTGGVYNTTPPIVSDGQVVDTQSDSSGNTKVTLATSLNATDDSITSVPVGATPLNISASTLVYTGAAKLIGMYVNSTTVGTIKFWDNTSAAVPVLNNTITPAIGYHPLGNAQFNTGLYATIGGTLDVTLYYTTQ